MLANAVPQARLLASITRLSGSQVLDSQAISQILLVWSRILDLDRDRMSYKNQINERII